MRFIEFHYIDSERRGTYTHEELSQMFATMLEDAGSITDSFDHNYNRWIEYMGPSLSAAR